jgi:hypothetical protein
MYVGRFMWAFAGIEAAIDNIFEIMFNLNAVSFLLLQSNLDLRKKLKLLSSLSLWTWPAYDPTFTPRSKAHASQSLVKS